MKKDLMHLSSEEVSDAVLPIHFRNSSNQRGRLCT